MTLFERMTDSQLHDYIMETLNKALNVVGTNSQRISEMDRLNSQADRCKKYLEFRKQNRANIRFPDNAQYPFLPLFQRLL